MRVAPRATYRLQLRNGVGFREAAELVPYLAALGVSHVYCSPYVEARRGSSHGYDVVDPRRLDPALGDEADHRAFVAALERHGLGQILDWVPNHVGIGQGENPWWQELLAFGPASRYADFFDVDWRPGRPELRGKVLLPVLGGHYGDVLERGELVPGRDAAGGLAISYHEHRFPVSPASWGRLLARELLGRSGEPEGAAQAELRRVLAALWARGRRADRVARTLEAQRRLGALIEDDAALGARVDAVVARLRGEPGRPASFDALHRLLEAQHYRLAWWRVAAEEINYRRFFDINELAAVRMERPEVFEHVHQRVFEWIEQGFLDGLRIDHVDGLADPRGYCARIRARFGPERLWLLVEKILGEGERLREDWGSDGTTGYEFLNLAGGLFVDPRGRAPLERLYRSFTGEKRSFDEVVRDGKRRAMRALLASELDGLVAALDRIAQGDRHTRDFTLASLRTALADVVAAFPVYRSYVGPAGAGAEDRRRIAHAVERARQRAEDPDSGLHAWLERVLSGDLARGEHRAARRRELQRFVTRFEQYTAPVMAKGLEDTAFYRHPVLVSLCEVGGDPRRFGVAPEAFHAANRERAARFPRGLLAGSTHDTKRGEDARARLAVLSERCAAWAAAVRAWSQLARSARRTLAGEPAPVRKDEYLVYQVLVGSFPALPLTDAGLAAYRERVQAYLVKALREGKERSSWRHPSGDYEAAVTGFVADLLAPGSGFLEAFRPFADEIARAGATNGLAQLALRLTAPGVPDVYQGGESWDLSLADPDNRRPVDFAARRAVQRELEQGVGADGVFDPVRLAELRAGWRDGRIKHLILWRLLDLRAARPGLFADAGYLPLLPTGERADRLCAFARTPAPGDGSGDALLVVVPRLCADLPRGDGDFPLGRDAWGTTSLPVPDGVAAPFWREAVTGRRIEAGGGALHVARLFEDLPLAVLAAEGVA